MADTITLNSGSGGAVLATQDEAGVHYQEVKLTASGNGTTESLSKAEDSVHVSGDHGLMALAVRRDAASTLVSASGDYSPLIVDANGRLHVIESNSASVVGALTSILADTATIDSNIAAMASDINIIDTNIADIEVLLISMLADTTTIDTNMATVAGAVAAGQMQVDIVAPLPAGTNNIGDIDVLSMIPGVGATNLGKAEDAAHTTGDTGVMSLAVRNDSMGNLVSADGDYAPLQVTSSGALYVHQPQGLQDDNNSTTTPLAASGVFTGSATELTNYSAISLFVYSDVGSAANGLSIQYSADATNWDHVETYTVVGGTSLTIQLMAEAKYYRIVYTNGATLQTTFRMKAMLKVVPSTSEITQLSKTVSDMSDAQLVRAVLAGKNPGSTYTNIEVTTGGNLKTSLEEISGGLDIGAGNAGTETQRVSISTDDVNLSAINANIADIELLLNSIDTTALAILVDTSNIDNNTANAAAALATLDNIIGTDVAVAPTNNAVVAGVYTFGGKTLATGQAGSLSLDSAGSVIQSSRVVSLVHGDSKSNSPPTVVGELGNFTTQVVYPYMYTGAAWDRLRGDATNGLTVNDSAKTSGGASAYYNNGVATLAQIKGSTGQLYFISAVNLNSSVVYLQLFDALSASVTLGTTTPTLEFAIPTQGSANGAGFMLPLPKGIAFASGISYAITTTKKGAVALTADTCLLNIGYK